MLGGVREKNGIKSGSINGGVKAACNTILADWSARQAPAANAAPAADAAQEAAPAAPTPVAYPQGSAQVQTATQTTAGDPVSQDDVASAAKKAQQYKACLALAKDNPSIVCNQ
jgi:hypothetical protein